MVIPVTREVKLSDVKKFVGNNLQLNLKQNWCTILIIGNNCTVTISGNYGAVKIVGNNCVADIVECRGTIEYIGNNGRVSYGDSIRPKNVSYIGLNGYVGENSGKKCTDQSQEDCSTNGFLGREVLSCSQLADKAILIKNNVKVVNPAIRVKLYNMPKDLAFIPKTPSDT